MYFWNILVQFYDNQTLKNKNYFKDAVILNI